MGRSIWLENGGIEVLPHAAIRDQISYITSLRIIVSRLVSYSFPFISSFFPLASPFNSSAFPLASPASSYAFPLTSPELTPATSLAFWAAVSVDESN